MHDDSETTGPVLRVSTGKAARARARQKEGNGRKHVPVLDMHVANFRLDTVRKLP